MDKLTLALDKKVQDLRVTFESLYEKNREKEQIISSSLEKLSQSLACPSGDAPLPPPLCIDEESDFCQDDDDFEEFGVQIKRSKLAKGAKLERVRISDQWKIICFEKVYIGFEIKNISEKVVKEISLLITDIDGSAFDYYYEAFSVTNDGIPLHLHSVPFQSCVNPFDREILYRDLIKSRGLEKTNGTWSLAPSTKCQLVACISLPSFDGNSSYTYVSMLTASVPERYGKKWCPLQIPMPSITLEAQETLTVTCLPGVQKNRLFPALYLHQVHRSFVTRFDPSALENIIRSKLGFSLLESGNLLADKGVLEGMFLVHKSHEEDVLLDCYCRDEKQLNIFLVLFKSFTDAPIRAWSEKTADKEVSTLAAKQAFLLEIDHVISSLEKRAESPDEFSVPPLVKKDSGKFGADASAEKELRESLKKLELREQQGLSYSKEEFEEFWETFLILQDETNQVFSQ